jgi:hypothetical protein
MKGYFDFAFGGGGGEGDAGFFTTTWGGLRRSFWILPFLPSCTYATYVVLNGCGSLRLIVIAS